MSDFKKNFVCHECDREFMILQQETYNTVKKNKKCFDCKSKSEPMREIKKDKKIIQYSYCCDKRKELFERHIRPDCEACNRLRHYKKYELQGLKMPCQDHIISDIFEELCPHVCEHHCDLNELSVTGKLDTILKNYVCDDCSIINVNNGNLGIVWICKCGRKFCEKCSINHFLMLPRNSEGHLNPESYICFDCIPSYKEEAIRLGQIL